MSIGAFADRRGAGAGARAARDVRGHRPGSAGSGRSSARAMALFMFGFIGLPPAGLFLGKFYAFSARHRARLGVARDRRRRRHRGLDLLLPRHRARDVHASPRRSPSRPPAARLRATSPLGTAVLLAARRHDRELRRRRAAARHRARRGRRPHLPALMPRARRRPRRRGHAARRSSRPCADWTRRSRITLVENELVGRRVLLLGVHPVEDAAPPARDRLPSPARARARGASLDPEQVFWWRDQIAGKDDTSQVKWLARLGAEVVRGKGASSLRASARRRRRRSSPTTSSWSPPARCRRCRRSRGSTACRALDEPRSERARARCPRASSSSAAARSAASWRSSTRGWARSVTLVQSGDYLLPTGRPRGRRAARRTLRGGRDRALPQRARDEGRRRPRASGYASSSRAASLWSRRTSSSPPAGGRTSKASASSTSTSTSGSRASRSTSGSRPATASGPPAT